MHALRCVPALVCVASCTSPAHKDSSSRSESREPVRITQFYSPKPVIGRGDSATLCYGVENAKRVSIAPEVDRIWPAFVRCISFAPTVSATYTLTAEGEDGRIASQSARIDVGPPRPRILEVSVNKLLVSRGEQVIICYKARHATAVDAGGLRAAVVTVGAGSGSASATPDQGCYGDRPLTTKTYIIRITGPGGEDAEAVTVHVQ
jgi:hypothetical protein